MIWTNPLQSDNIDCKGIETVRRDNCEFVPKLIDGALERLMRNFDKEAAIEYCKGMINDLLSNRVDLSLLVITKGLTKKLQSQETIPCQSKPSAATGDNDEEMAAVEEEKPAKPTKKSDTYGKKNMAHVCLAQRMR